MGRVGDNRQSQTEAVSAASVSGDSVTGGECRSMAGPTLNLVMPLGGG